MLSEFATLFNRHTKEIIKRPSCMFSGNEMYPMWTFWCKFCIIKPNVLKLSKIDSLVPTRNDDFDVTCFLLAENWLPSQGVYILHKKTRHKWRIRSCNAMEISCWHVGPPWVRFWRDWITSVLWVTLKRYTSTLDGLYCLAKAKPLVRAVVPRHGYSSVCDGGGELGSWEMGK